MSMTGRNERNAITRNSDGKVRSSAARWMQTILLAIYDLLAVNVAFFLALWFRFDCRFSMIDEIYLDAWLHFAPLYSLVCIIVFIYFKLYQSIWRFASYTELYRVIKATVITCLFHIVAIILLFHRMPVSYYIIGSFFQFVLLIGIRFSYRLILLLNSYKKSSSAQPLAKVMLIGGGSSGQMILRDIMHSDIVQDEVCCIIDEKEPPTRNSSDGKR